MKSRIFILSAALFLFTIFHSFQGNAQAGVGSPAPVYYPGNYLPINNGIVFLTIAGIIIGIVAVKKYHSVKTSV